MEPIAQRRTSRYRTILPLMDRLSGSGQLFEVAAGIVAEIEDSIKRANGTEK